MSQHIWYQRRLRICAGWDRPLQYHFLTVHRGATVVYSNLTDPDLLDGGGAMTPGLVLERLLALRITPPPQLLDRLIDDAYDNAGNTITHYDKPTQRMKE